MIPVPRELVVDTGRKEALETWPLGKNDLVLRVASA